MTAILNRIVYEHIFFFLFEIIFEFISSAAIGTTTSSWNPKWSNSENINVILFLTFTHLGNCEVGDGI